MLRSVTLTKKILFISIIASIVIWGVLDFYHTRSIKNIFQKQMINRLENEAHNNRIQFDRYVQSYYKNAGLITSLSDFTHYIEANINLWESSKTEPTKINSELPQWLPRSSLLRTIASVRYAFIMDKNDKVRELYNGWSEVPTSLLTQINTLKKISSNQSHITFIEDFPYLIASSPLTDNNGKLLATLMIASPMDDEFLVSSQIIFNPDTITVLLGGKPPLIYSSSRNDLLPAGSNPDDHFKDYMETGTAFFDYGASEIHVQYTTLISMTSFVSITDSLLKKERQQRALTAILLIITFLLIITWITKKIQGLTTRVVTFSKQYLGVELQDLAGRPEFPH